MIDRKAAIEVIGAPFGTRSGDVFCFDGVEYIVGETEWTSGMGKAVVAWLITPLLAALYRLRFQARVEGRQRHLTSEPLPCHDPPVAWEVALPFDLLAVACPALVRTGFTFGSLPAAVPVLDSEPGRLS